MDTDHARWKRADDLAYKLEGLAIRQRWSPGDELALPDYEKAAKVMRQHAETLRLRMGIPPPWR